MWLDPAIGPVEAIEDPVVPADPVVDADPEADPVVDVDPEDPVVADVMAGVADPVAIAVAMMPAICWSRSSTSTAWPRW